MNELTVMQPGRLALIQDLGRHHYLAQGVSISGAADRRSHALGQRLCGNPESVASIEVLFGGLKLRSEVDCVMATTGADSGARVDDLHVGHNVAISIRAGSTLTLGQPATGLRTYVSVRGGISVAAVLGSRSRDTLGGIGPAPLQPGEQLTIGGEGISPPWYEVIPVHPLPTVLALALMPGPHDDLLDAAGWDQLINTVWSVDSNSNRIGFRLSGPPLSVPPSDLPSFAIVPASMQLPGSGLPIVLGPDAGTTGGYPVLGTVRQRDLDALAQARPGDRVTIRRR